MSSGWPRRAACRYTDPDLFFPEGPLSNALIEQMDRARAVCASCPVRLHCLDAELTAERGLSASERSGIRGGLDGPERYALSRGRRLPKRPRPIPDDGQEHGVRRTYRKGCRCFACTAAETEKKPNPRPVTPCRTKPVRARPARRSEPAGTEGLAAQSTSRARARHADEWAECGTRSGYQRHLNDGEIPCAACTAADLAVAWFVRGRRPTAS